MKYDTEYKFKVDISLDDTVAVNNGDTLIVEDPDAFVILKTDAFTIYDAQGNPAGTAQKDPNSNKIIFTFNDFFEGLNENKQFGFEFNAQVSRRVTNNTEVAPTDSFPIPPVVTPPAQGIYPGEKIAKWGSQDKSDPSLVHWEIRYNPNRESLTNVDIIDTLSSNHTLVSVDKIIYYDAWNPERLLTNPAEATPPTIAEAVTAKPDGTGFTVHFDQIDRIALIQYTTKLTAPGNPSNSVSAVVNGTTVQSIENREVTLGDGSGYASGSRSEYIILEAQKTYEGGTLNGGDFEFELVNADTDEVIATVKNNADGKVSFPVLKYSSPGDYNYIIREVAGTDQTINYDSNEYKVKVNVTVENGKHLGTVTYENGEIPTFVNTVKPTPFSIPVKLRAEKVLEGKELAGNDFSFELLQDGQVLDKKQNDASGKVTFDELVFTEEGTFVYKLREVNDSQENIVYDETVVTATVTVTRIKDGALAKIEYSTGAVGEKRVLSATATIVGGAGGLTSGVGHTSEIPAAASFVNQYVEPTPASIVLEAHKTLEGRTLNDSEFSFVLVDAKTKEEIETAVNDVNGKISFSAIEYASAGEHKYIIREVAGTDANIVYDSKSYSVNVKVTAENDTYVAEVTYETTDGSVPTFVNTVKPDPDPDPDPDPTPDPEPTPETPTYSGTMKKQVLPNTGQANHSLISIIGLVLLILVGITSRLLAGYKK